MLQVGQSPQQTRYANASYAFPATTVVPRRVPQWRSWDAPCNRDGGIRGRHRLHPPVRSPCKATRRCSCLCIGNDAAITGCTDNAVIFLVAVSGLSCQNCHIQPTNIQTMISPAVTLEGVATIELETGEVVTDRQPPKRFGVADQRAFIRHVKEELEPSRAFLRITLNHDADSAYLIKIIFQRTVAAGSDLSGIYHLDVELKIYDHRRLSLQRAYNVVTPEHEMLAFYVDATIRATKARAANDLHRRVMQDIKCVVTGCCKACGVAHPLNRSPFHPPHLLSRVPRVTPVPTGARAKRVRDTPPSSSYPGACAVAIPRRPRHARGHDLLGVAAATLGVSCGHQGTPRSGPLFSGTSGRVDAGSMAVHGVLCGPDAR